MPPFIVVAVVILFIFFASIWVANKRSRNIKPWPAKNDAAAKKDWLSNTTPWRTLDPAIIDALTGKFRDNPMFEVFIVISMEHNLVARYAELAKDKLENSDLICSQIATMLCFFGNASVRVMGDLMHDCSGNRSKLEHHYRIVRDAFEVCIILDHNQLQAYAGLATAYGLIGKSEECVNYAQQGLSKLQELKTDDDFCAYIGAVPDGAQTKDELEKVFNSLVDEYSAS